VRRAPRLFHLRRVGRDADQVGLELLHKLGDRLLFDVGVKNHHLIAAALAHGGQIGQPQMRSRARVDRQPESWIDECYSHVCPPSKTLVRYNSCAF
jgi:hypothetical protein